MKALDTIKSKIRMLFTQKKPKDKSISKISGTDFKKLNETAYQFVGEKIDRALPIFKDLDFNLQKAELRISFRPYVSIIIFITLVSTLSLGVALPLVLWAFFGMAFLPSLLFGLGASLLVGVGVVIGFYFYPIYKADKHKREVDDELPFTTGYMAILGSAGVPPEKVFASLAALREPLAASSEAKDFVRYINLFGMDIISALEKTSKRTPSDKLRDILEGIISTIHSGGNLAGYLRERFQTQINLRKIVLKKYADTLSLLAEVYVVILLTGPLLFVIMLSVMSVMGGGNIGGLSSDLLLKLITYIGIPFAAIMFLVIVDSTSPKW